MFGQGGASLGQVSGPGLPVHNGSLLTAKFGAEHNVTVPEVWEHRDDYERAHSDNGTTPGTIDRAFGAFTVRNENDTDGDEIPDNEDDEVRAVGINNRDEVDLIKLVVVPPEDLNALAKITLSSSDGAGNSCVVFWKHEQKIEKYGDGTLVIFSDGAAGVPIEVWAEIPGQSPAIVGWTVHCSFVKKDRLAKNAIILRNEYDRIAVTSIWAEPGGVRVGRHEIQVLEKPSPSEVVVPWVSGIHMNTGDWIVLYDDHNGSGTAEYDTATQCFMSRVVAVNEHPQWPELAVVEFADLPLWVDPGDFFTDGLSPEVDNSSLIETFNLFHVFCHIGATRYRNRPAHRLQTRFIVLPYGTAVTRMSNGEFPKFDIARQATQQRKVGFPAPRIPWPLGNEEPNDQQGAGGVVDQDTETTHGWQGLIRIDAPGQPMDAEGVPLTTRVEMRMNAFEFVRVGLAGTRPTGDNVRGSSCSAKLVWRAGLDIMPGEDGYWHKTVDSPFNLISTDRHWTNAELNELGGGN